MAGAMSELFSETSAFDDATRDIVHFRAVDTFSFPDILAHELSRRIACFANDVENADVLLRHRVTDKTGPGLIGANRAGLPKLADDIEQHEIAALNRRGLFLG